jgi:hypothetical protein
VADADAPAGSPLAGAVTGVRLVATDVMAFAGIDFDAAVAAVREGMLRERVVAPAPTRRRHFDRLRRRLMRS